MFLNGYLLLRVVVKGIFDSFKGPVSKATICCTLCLNECTHCAVTFHSFSLPFQVDLLLGKAYSVWGHVSDAVSVYNQLISTYPDDFRGYLAKVLSIWSILYRDGYLHFFYLKFVHQMVYKILEIIVDDPKLCFVQLLV